MNRSLLVLVAGSSMLFSAGCATKKFVRNETAPIINKTNELDDLTAKNSRDIRDVDARAQQGIAGVNTAAAAADQKALAAGQAATEAQTLASNAVHRVDSLQNAVVNLDNYRPVSEASVHFAIDKADLTPKAKSALDELATNFPNAKGYIVEVTGGTDSTGPSSYNYQLSERRASSVVQYLAQKYNVPARKIYVVGLGKDKTVAPNTTATGRAQNRRVEVRVLSNVQDSQAQSVVSKAATGGF